MPASQPITEVVDGIINLIKKNVIAKTNLSANVVTGDTVASVVDSFHFEADQEIVLIDQNYNVEGTPHYQVFEYAKIKSVANTHALILTNAVVGNWLTSDLAFVQKTIGHTPLYTENVLYGDREVIPTDSMAVTVEPVSMSNEWMYIPGGLNKEYRIGITVYGKNIETEEGIKVLNLYTDAIYNVLMGSLFTEINNYTASLVTNSVIGSNTVVIADTTENSENFVITATEDPCGYGYAVQDNKHTERGFNILNVTARAGLLFITIDGNLSYNYTTAEYAVFVKLGRFMWDSRVDAAEFGTVQKGSAYIKAGKLNWFGKEICNYTFPQPLKG